MRLRATPRCVRTGCASALVALASAGCARGGASVEPPPAGAAPASTSEPGSGPTLAPSASAQALSFPATVRLPTEDEQGKGRKVFRGVVLERDDGSRWVASYVRDDLWQVFADRRVSVTGRRYVPEHQALVLPHIAVDTLSLGKPDPAVAFVSMGPERWIEGRFETTIWPEGTKLAGEKQTHFVATGGATFLLSRLPPDAPMGPPVRIRARSVEPSPFEARPGGDYLWVYEVVAR